MALVERADTRIRTCCKIPPTTTAPAVPAGALSTRHAWQATLSRVAERAETPRWKVPGVSCLAGGRRTNSKLGRQAAAILKPGQWIKLIDRLGQIQNPTVRVKPSKYAITVVPAHAGDG